MPGCIEFVSVVFDCEGSNLTLMYYIFSVVKEIMMICLWWMFVTGLQVTSMCIVGGKIFASEAVESRVIGVLDRIRKCDSFFSGEEFEVKQQEWYVCFRFDCMHHLALKSNDIVCILKFWALMLGT